MGRSGWLALAIAAGAAIVALSFVDAWIVQRRELTGEGYRVVVSTAGAWISVGLPVLAAGVVAAVATAGVALGTLRGPRRLAGWLLPAAAVAAFGLIGATLVPVSQDGHASRIDLSPGWAAFVGVVLVAAMLVAALRAARPARRHALALAGLALVVLGAGGAGRWVALQAGAAPTDAWATGTYTRAAIDGRPQATLTVGNGTYRIGELWSGTWESHSWTVILVDDPACPGGRGTYHAHNVGPDGADLRFVRVVDTCADGARSADLETGVWERDP